MSSLKKWLDEINDLNFELIRDVKGKKCNFVFCRSCGKRVDCKKKFQLKQHIETAMHKKNSELKRKQSTLMDKPSCSGVPNEFYLKLCRAFVSANIPLKKLENETLKNFLEENCGKKIPDESTLRKSYVQIIYKEVIDKIRKDIADHKIYIIIDETTDSCGRYVANVIVGKLDGTPATGHLIACRFLEKTNSCTIAWTVRDALRVLWPEEEYDERFLLFVTDSAAYMLKAGQDLKIFYPRVIHVTCVVHGLHRLAEEIRKNFNDVNKLISSTKKVFLKAPGRVALFKEQCPDTRLPPEPVLTRWGTWIEAALYYAENFDKIETILDMLDDGEATSIRMAKQAIQEKSVKNSLAYIRAHFSSLSPLIKSLEGSGMQIVDVLQLLDDFQDKLPEGRLGDIFKLKWAAILNRNEGLKIIRKICNILKGEEEENLEWQPAEISCLKFAPLSSVDVERSFSRYKNVLTDNRRSLTEKNIEHLLVASCYNFC